ncbi:MAG: DUF4258 domain-containing protein, partial [Gammaproteobacteria bacterium]
DSLNDLIGDLVTGSMLLQEWDVSFRAGRCVRELRIFWTYHVNIRLAQRYIARQAILDAVDGHELVEAYPQDKYLPSYLVLAKHAGSAFRVLFAIDVEGE